MSTIKHRRLCVGRTKHRGHRQNANVTIHSGERYEILQLQGFGNISSLIW